MARIFQTGPFKLFRRGAYGLAIAIPICSSAILAESSKDENIIYLESTSNTISGPFYSSSKKLFLNKELENNYFRSSSSLYKLANNSDQEEEEKLFLIAEVIIEGIEDHPEKKRLQYAAYDAMSIRPGSKVTRKDVKTDLEAIYSTGLFSGVTIDPIETPLGIRMNVKVKPNPFLKNIEISPVDSKINRSVLNDIFRRDYGKILNLNILQLRIKEIRKWYSDKGYSLARITGPNRISPEGIVELNVQEGKIEDIEIVFINEDGDTENEDGKKVRSKTKNWVIEREIASKPGEVFNRKELEKDIKRLYSTSLFSDLKVTLKPVANKPGNVIIVLGVTEQRTGTLTGGIGYSGSQGVFGQGGLQESNLLGRSWKTDFNLSYGEFGGLINLSLTDPWIKGDKYRTSFRTSLFVSREVPTELRSQSNGHIKGISERFEPSSSYTTAYDIASTTPTGSAYTSVDLAKAANSNFSWFDYEGDSIVLERTGFGFSFARPMNGGNPFKKAKWSALVGMSFQKVRPIDYAGSKRPYGVPSKDITDNSAPKNSVICVAYNCADENTLASLKIGTSYNNLDDSRNPTSGNLLSINSEQFISLGNNSPTFNRSRLGYSYFIPVKWVKFTKGCKPKENEKYDCPQTVGFQAKTGTIIGDLPPYEAFCLGGTSSVRGWSNCDLAVGRTFGEASVEYRFPIWRIVSGAFFVDAGTDFGSQSNVPGQPGKLLKKDGSGFSTGTGVVINTPVGPIRLEAASKDFGNDWRYNIGVGWKF
tara:strand:- start:13782 stop:16064 length:2283 start_codon:yes stop_codon:yes gene_type:complete